MARNIMRLICFLVLDIYCLGAMSQNDKQLTYCNPINIDYGYTPIPNFSEWGRHRATADPVIVNYKGDYYLFSTNQWGYWWSNDMLKWNFISKKFCTPSGLLPLPCPNTRKPLIANLPVGM